MNNDLTTEELILEAAERLFLEKGFASTSTTEIAKEVGCNQAMVHYYFRTKEKLFEAIFDDKINKFIAPVLEQSFEEGSSFEEQLKLLIEAHFDIIRENPQIPFLIVNEMLVNPDRMESIKEKMAQQAQRFIAKFGNSLAAEIEKGNIRPIQPFDLIISVVSLNITLFLISPIIKTIDIMTDEMFEQIVENRKQENVLTILRSLRP